LSGRITKTIIDLAGFSFLFDRVRCGLVRSFLVRNWCGSMRTPNRRSSPLDAGWAFAALSALGRSYLLVGRTSSRTTSKQAKCIEGHGPLFGRPIVDDVQLLRQDCVRP
jgi:hypothetical protein